jgi:hypothetical protein
MLHLSANFNGTLRHGAPVVIAIAVQCSLALPAFMAAIQRAMWSGSRQPRLGPRYEPDRGMELFVSLA